MFNGKSLFGTTRLAGGFQENSSFVGVLYTKTARHPIGKPRRRSDSSEQKDDIRPNGTGFRESGLVPEQNERMNTEWTDTDKTEKTARFSL